MNSIFCINIPVAVVLVAVAAAVVATTFVVEYSSDWHCKHWFVVVVASNCIAAP